MAGDAHRLTVTIIGAGDVVGGVRSTPAGLDCALAIGPGGLATKACTSEFPDGEALTLAFVPDGSSDTAQFFIKRADVDSKNCGEFPASTIQSCQLVLDADVTVAVYPVSAAPF